MDTSRILKFLLIIEMIALLGAAAAISRDYQDSWILEGLEIPYVVFMVTYITYIFTEKKITWMIPFALIFRSVILLIPNLKYIWFQGVAIDQHSHYRLAQDIYDEGYIPSGRLYSDTPLMHLSFVIYSIIIDVPVLCSFKYWPILPWSIYPLVIYVIIKNSGMKKNSSLFKYAVIISCIPVKETVSYIVIGTLFGPLLSLLVLSRLVKGLQKRDRRDWIVAIIYNLALVATHSYSSIMLIITLFAMYLMMLYAPLLRKLVSKNFTRLQLRPVLQTLVVIALVNIAWVSHKAFNILDEIIKTYMIPYMSRLMGAEVFVEEPIPPRFFRLISVNFIEGLKVILLYHGGDILLMLLTLVGILVVVKKLRLRSKSLVFLSFYILSLWLFLIMGLILRIGVQWYDRIIRLSLIVFPIFSSISLFYINKKTRSTKLSMFAISMLMMLATLQLYGYQPLMPPASSISKDLPMDEPIGERVWVNSAYQRNMIKHAETYIPEVTLIAPHRIASDSVTLNQIIGLTNYDFSSSHLSWYYPLDKSAPEKNYDYFLIHLPGRSGAFHEKAEIRTRSLILEAIYDSDILYTNGESYILVVKK